MDIQSRKSTLLLPGRTVLRFLIYGKDLLLAGICIFKLSKRSLDPSTNWTQCEVISLASGLPAEPRSAKWFH